MEKELTHHNEKTTQAKKKRRRWTRDEKRQRSLEDHATHTSSPKKLKATAPASVQERKLECAERHKQTQSVTILKRSDADCPGAAGTTIGCQVFTVGSQEYSMLAHEQNVPSSLPSTINVAVCVKPLLVLDVNGILCHRIRQPDRNPHVPFRRAVKTIAGTPVVLRPCVFEFLAFLSQHFCLAIWTSAKAKTAHLLLKAVMPPGIRSNLLFAWSQKHCQRKSATRGEDDDRNAIFVKSLQKVYNRYPLWSSANTILIDDSPEKCPEEDIPNTLHPPSMHGKKRISSLGDSIRDEENHERQMQFFELLNAHLNSQSRLESRVEGEHHLDAFFRLHARGHMGWRG